MHSDDSSLLKAYIAEWTQFFDQSRYLPEPFGPLEKALESADDGVKVKKNQKRNIVRKVRATVYFFMPP